MGLTKEQIEQIEREAEIDVDKAPIDYYNEKAYAWKAGYELGYKAAATKYLLQSIEDKELEYDKGLAYGLQLSSERDNARIKELEECLKEMLDWSIFVKIEVSNKAKQLLSTNK